MYNYKDIEMQMGKRDYFPNADTAAYFDPESQTIHLNKIRKKDFINALTNNRIPEVRTMLGTMMHEATHWADIIGTRWGRNYLHCLYQCFRILPRTGSTGAEDEFHCFIELHDQQRRIMHSRYFRTVHPNPVAHDHRMPWGLMLSAGKEFDTSGRLDEGRPIVFARFLDRTTGEQIARQPVVAGALLEINAMWSEMRTNFECITSLNKEEQAVESAMYSRELLGYMYNPGLTLYTAPAHILANHAKITDVITAYQLSSDISHVVLNLAPHHFAAIDPPQQLSPWSNLFDGFKKCHDCGFAFKAIVCVVNQWEPGMDRQAWIDDALRLLGLPSSRQIYEEAEVAMASYSPIDLRDAVNIAEDYLMSIGRKVLKIRANGDTALTSGRVETEKLPIVPMFDSDGELITTGHGNFQISKFSPEDMHALSATMTTWKRNFLNACR